jgi:metalloendopeptidase OMA1, mitochondrial
MQDSITTLDSGAPRPWRFAPVDAISPATGQSGSRPGRRSAFDRIAAEVARAVLVVAALFVAPGATIAATWSVQELVAQTVTRDPSYEVPLADGAKTEHARVLHLRRLRDVHARIAKIAEIQSDLRIVPGVALNALAVYRPATIVITTSMLRLVGDDESMLAAILGHEFAHLALRHSARKAVRATQHARVGIVTGRQIAVEVGDASQAQKAAQLVFLLLQAEFSREQETEADRIGTRFIARAGYDPDGTIRLLKTMSALVGSRPTRYLDTHPGLEERVSQAEPAVVSEHFRLLADRLYAAGSWSRLLRTTDYWLNANVNAAYAWYYRGASLKALGHPGALEAFEQAIAKDPGVPGAQLALCIEIYQAGRTAESLTCSERLKGNEQRVQFEAQTFGHTTHVYRANRRPSSAGRDIRIIRH